MSYIIGKACFGCIDTACVAVCPVDVINGPFRIDDRGDGAIGLSEEDRVGKQLYINPAECIDCGACVPECPVDAIYRDEDEAIEKGDEISVHKNYEFYGQVFSKKI